MSGVLFITRQDEKRVREFFDDLKKFIKVKDNRICQPAIREVKMFQVSIDYELFEVMKEYMRAIGIQAICFPELHRKIKKLPFFKRLVESPIIKVSKQEHFLLEFPSTADDWIEDKNRFVEFWKVWQKQYEKNVKIKELPYPPSIAPNFEDISKELKSFKYRIKKTLYTLKTKLFSVIR